MSKTCLFSSKRVYKVAPTMQDAERVDTTVASRAVRLLILLNEVEGGQLTKQRWREQQL